MEVEVRVNTYSPSRVEVVFIRNSLNVRIAWVKCVALVANVNQLNQLGISYFSDRFIIESRPSVGYVRLLED